MKKILSMILCLVLTFSLASVLVGCGEVPAPEAKDVTVSFNTFGGSAVASQTVKEGSLVTKPADPTKEGLIFAGWFKTQDDVAEAWNFETDTVSANTIIYAKWTRPEAPATVTVTFDLKGGEGTFANVTVDNGGKLTAPETNPTKTGYNFSGWYADEACTDAWDFENDTVTSDTTLYAGWTAVGGGEGGDGGEGGEGGEIPDVDEDRETPPIGGGSGVETPGIPV